MDLSKLVALEDRLSYSLTFSIFKKTAEATSLHPYFLILFKGLREHKVKGKGKLTPGPEGGSKMSSQGLCRLTKSIGKEFLAVFQGNLFREGNWSTNTKSR